MFGKSLYRDQTAVATHKGSRTNVMRCFSILFLTISFIYSIAACSAQHGRGPDIEELYTSKKFIPQLQQKYEVNIGDAFFVEGLYIPGEYIIVQEPLDMMIPGSMMIPFPVHIEPGRLFLDRIRSGWKYYCAEEGRASASFPGLGSVLRKGDCVGIRIAAGSTKMQWVVDNSNYNNSRTIWTKSLSESEKINFAPEISDRPFKVQSLRRIVFDGYYGNQLHFTWNEIGHTFHESKEFTFDYDGTPTILGIKGFQFKVFKADNISLSYEWIKLK